MKKKFSRIFGLGLTVAMVASLMLAAAPVAANVSEPKVTLTPNSISTEGEYLIKFDTDFPLDGGHGELGDLGDGVAEWSTAQKKSGSYSAKLSGTNDWVDYARVTIAVDIDPTSFTPASDLSYYLYVPLGTYGPYVELVSANHMANNDMVPSTAYNGDFVEYTPAAVGDDWQLDCGAFGNTWADAVTNFDGERITSIRIVLSGDISDTSYVDDISIDGGTTYYDLEYADTITVVFPSGTTVPDSYTAGSITVCKDTYATTPDYTASTNVSLTEATNTAVITVPKAAETEAAAHMGIMFLTDPASGIINPATPGDYTLKVCTSSETTKVESEVYTVGIPGVVSRYNKSGNYVGSYNTIQEALNAASESDRLKLGPGTYEEDPDTADASLTIEATGEMAETIIKGDFTVDKDSVTLRGLTFKGTVTVSGIKCVIEDSAFTKKKSTTTDILLTVSGDDLSVTDCTIDTTYGSVTDTGVVITDGNDVTFSGCTFTTDAGTVTNQDKAFYVVPGSGKTVEDLMVKSCDFSGTKGTGYYDNAIRLTTATVKDSTFDGFEKAFDIDQTVALTKLTLQNNTITNSCKATVGALDIDGTTDATAIIITGNTFEDNVGYSVHLDASVDVDYVSLIGNNFINNTKGLKNASTEELSAINNWWGDVSGPSGEGVGEGDAISTYVEEDPWLTALAPAGQATTAATSLDAKKAVSVKVSGLAAARPADLIWVANYEANPETVEPEYDALADAWFDVYLAGSFDADDEATIKFYADGITADTDAYVWSELQGKWLACSDQGASATGGIVWVKVGAETTPSLDDLSGLPFVLVAAPAAAKPTFVLTAPEAGATDMPATNVPFTWASYSGATSYDLVLSASYDLSAPIAEVAGIAGTAYTYTGTLGYSSPYYWQVTAMRGSTVKAKSDVATFLTAVEPEAVLFTCQICGLTFDTRAALEAHIAVAHPPVAPVAPVAPVITVEAPPAPPPAAITVEAPAPTPAPAVTVNVPPAAPVEAPPSPAYVWVVIAIGALLVIAVIILIVRTRRVV